MAAPNPETAVSNSFDYVPVRPLDGFVLDVAACSARDMGLAGAGSSRVVLVNAGGRSEQDADGGCSEAGRTVLCRTDTGDFDEAGIRLVVHDRGQLYLDVSGKPSINDFAADVRQMVVAPECRRCPDFPLCCAYYVTAPRSFFDDDERWLAGLMRSLGGRVLDVGLGNVPYLRFAGDAIREYHGVDPDPEAGRHAAPDLTLHNLPIEAFAGFDGYFDTVLSLRSLNHFIDVRAGVGAILRCLRPGGRVVFIESLALPLIRTHRQADNSHQAAAGGFQHLRNWDSSQLLDLVSEFYPLDFDVAFHRPIGLDTCDQWIVVLTRR